MHRSMIRKISRAACFFSALGMASFAPPAYADVLTPTIEIDKPVMRADQDDAVYVLVRFEVPEADTVGERDRSGLNLALVLDRSGSMEAKGKLEFLKSASKTVIDRLESHDRLAIVEYDDKVTVLWPSSPVEAKSMMKRRVDDLEPRGATDLTGGMMAGVDQVRGAFDDARINRVLLLSDGLANRGITDPYEIRTLVRKAKRRGIRISTLGLGLEYNEDLMQDIAENAGGNYYFVENPDQVAGIFRREILTLFRTVARDVKLRFEGERAVAGIEVFGYEGDVSNGRLDLAMDDFYAGEARSLLLRLDVVPGARGRLELGTLRLSYKDVGADRQKEFSAPITIKVSDSDSEVQEARNDNVTVEVAMVEAEKSHREAIRQFQKGDYKGAEESMSSLATDLDQRNARLKDARLAAKIEALRIERDQMNKAATAPAAAAPAMMSGFVKSSKQRLYQAQKGQRGLYMLQKGDNGFDVERLQKALAASGHYTGPMDGAFDDDVAHALEAYQKDHGLDVDGIAGPNTLQNLGLY